MVRKCWVNFQCRGVLRTWITVGQGPIVLALGAGGGCLDIFSLIYHFCSLSPSLWETARYRLKYCLKGPLSPKQPTNQFLKKRKEKRKYVARPGIEPRTPDLRVRWGWSGVAMVLGKLPVPGRPTCLDKSRARAYCSCSRCGWGLFVHFYSHLSFLFSFSLSLGDDPI